MSWPSGRMPALAISHGQVDVTSRPIPPPGDTEVLAEVAYVGICGSDLELLHGTSYYLEQKLNSYPVAFGHEWTGRVFATGSAVRDLAPGDPVIGQTIVTCGSCRACHAGRRTACQRRAEVGLFGRPGAAARFISMPERALTRLPDRLPLAEAVLIEPGVTAMNALARTRCTFDDRVVVIGTGTLGLLAVALALQITRGVDVIGVEPAGRSLALSLGARAAYPPGEAASSGYSVAIEASGAAAAVAMLGRLLEPGGRAALVGVVNSGTPEFVPAHITLKDIEIHGILHGLDHYDRVAALMAAGAFHATALIDRTVPWQRASQAFDDLSQRRITRPKILLDFTELFKSKALYHNGSGSPLEAGFLVTTVSGGLGGEPLRGGFRGSSPGPALYNGIGTSAGYGVSAAGEPVPL